jgi:hypothetical protein
MAGCISGSSMSRAAGLPALSTTESSWDDTTRFTKAAKFLAASSMEMVNDMDQ